MLIWHFGCPSKENKGFMHCGRPDDRSKQHVLDNNILTILFIFLYFNSRFLFVLLFVVHAKEINVKWVPLGLQRWLVESYFISVLVVGHFSRCSCLFPASLLIKFCLTKWWEQNSSISTKVIIANSVELENVFSFFSIFEQLSNMYVDCDDCKLWKLEIDMVVYN